MIRALFVAVVVLLSSSAHAARVALKPPAGVTKTASGPVASKGFAANDGQFSGGLTAEVGGTPIVAPATWRLAANAGVFALSAIRLNPYALVGGAVAAYLLEQGIEWIDGHWFKTDTAAVPFIAGGGWYISGEPNILHPTPEDAAQDFLQRHWPSGHYSVTHPTPNEYTAWFDYGDGIHSSSAPIYTNPGQCPAGYTYSQEQIGCIIPGQKRPMTDEDWPQNMPLPDSVANELANKGVGLPLEAPRVDTTPQRIPTSEPYTDPVTGKRVQDVIEARPDQSGEAAEVDASKEELDPATDEPKTDAEGNKEKDIKEDDFCKQNPDAMACWDEGDPEDVDIERRDAGAAISPVSVGGSGFCPAPKTAVGGRVVFSYQPFCNFASAINPLVLALAWLAAGYILMGAVKES